MGALGSGAGNLLFAPLYGDAGAAGKICQGGVCSARLCKAAACKVVTVCRNIAKRQAQNSAFGSAERAAERLLLTQAEYAAHGKSFPACSIATRERDHNPFKQGKNCVPVAIAADKTIAKGFKFTYTDSDIRLAGAGEATGPDEARSLLKQHYGDKLIDGLPERRLLLQSEGVIQTFTGGTPLQAKQAIEDELHQAAVARVGASTSGLSAPDSPRGIVFVDFKDGEGHAFNAVVDGAGNVRFWDYQEEKDATSIFSRATVVHFYRTN